MEYTLGSYRNATSIETYFPFPHKENSGRWFYARRDALEHFAFMTACDEGGKRKGPQFYCHHYTVVVVVIIIIIIITIRHDSKCCRC